MNLHMIHHLKALDLEITHFNYHHDPTPSGENISSQISNLKHVEIIKFQINLHMIHHLKALNLKITDFNYNHDPTL